ncbi:non-specific lipid transfer protein GPI-anchored 16-like [Andrographis paniculata]|uniref:non-specific lipid transfer protein GPI-anchored 16-like n=1 Tax=Andrographis paniculata TaxID=175694 RepID=UPI0021E73A30|nr:non-specific lipid transfer protein GPI-anchored 16-like [Andrographis paniculata]
MATSSPNAALILFLLPLALSIFQAGAQITTACTSSVITSFTPCLNFVTGSSGSGSSPTEDCCSSLKSLMRDNIDCACLIVTGNVPVSIPFVNSSMALTLPRACKSSVPLQCKATGVPLPPPGPVLFGPTSAPAPAPAAQPPAPRSHNHSHGLTPTPAPAPVPARRRHGPKASKTMAAPPPVESSSGAAALAPPPKFALGPSANPGIRPVFNPQSSSSSSSFPSLSVTVLFCAGILAAAANYY